MEKLNLDKKTVKLGEEFDCCKFFKNSRCYFNKIS